MVTFSGSTKLVSVVAGAYLIVFFVLTSGIVNAVIEGAGARGFIIPARNVQSVGETIAVTLILFIGFAGTLLLHKAGHAFSTRNQNAFLAGGFGIIGLSMLLGYILINAKA